jgi:hypothetical protein
MAALGTIPPHAERPLVMAFQPVRAVDRMAPDDPIRLLKL